MMGNQGSQDLTDQNSRKENNALKWALHSLWAFPGGHLPIVVQGIESGQKLLVSVPIVLGVKY